MSLNRVFCALKSNNICDEIEHAENRIVYVSPGLNPRIAESLIIAAHKLGTEQVTIVLDCDEDTCRLGYGYIEAIRMLERKGLRVRQSPGLRVGLFICDNKGWSYSPVALYVEDETFSDETPNAARLMPEQIDAFIKAVCPEEANLQADREREIGVEQLTEGEIKKVEENLKKAPPIRFDIMRQLRVFQPYIQYVTLKLQGCSINRREVKMPNDILNRNVGEQLQRRLKTSFNLVSNNSELSDKKLQEEIKKIRKKYLKPLGKHWGNVILRKNRAKFDREIDDFKLKVEKHQRLVESKLQEEIKQSIEQIVEAFWEEIQNDPPDDLLTEIVSQKPSEEIAKAWLRSKLDESFPRVEKIVKKMEVICQFSDVTYETLNQEGFIKSLKEKFKFVDWDKPYNEFKAAKEKTKNQ